MMVAAVAALAGAGIAAYSAVQQGNAAKAANDYNAAVARNNALQAKEAAAGNESTAARKASFVLGAQRAGAGAAGIDPNQGSPLSLMTDTAQQTTLDALRIKYGGDTQSAAYLNQGALDVASGRNAQAAGNLGGAATILGGAGRAFGAYYGGAGTAPADPYANGTMG